LAETYAISIPEKNAESEREIRIIGQGPSKSMDEG
jgi:hypothetical protein